MGGVMPGRCEAQLAPGKAVIHATVGGREGSRRSAASRSLSLLT
jgi:hypothetical protein